jgi:hypothetical protein
VLRIVYFISIFFFFLSPKASFAKEGCLISVFATTQVFDLSKWGRLPWSSERTALAVERTEWQDVTRGSQVDLAINQSYSVTHPYGFSYIAVVTNKPNRIRPELNLKEVGSYQSTDGWLTLFAVRASDGRINLRVIASKKGPAKFICAEE